LLISILRAESTVEKYKIGERSFVRNRKLNFMNMSILLLSKSVKSLQNRLNEFFEKILGGCETVTASAFTQARKKLSHMLFVDLNRLTVEMFYAEKTQKTFKGLYLIAIDGSKIYLPNSKDTKKEFTTIPVTIKDAPNGEYVGGLASVAYDVLNNIVVDSILTKQNASERDLARQHLEHLGKGYLTIYDRGYPSYELAASCYKKGVDFLFRCSRGWIKKVQEMYENEETDKIITYKRSMSKAKHSDLDLPEEIKIRLVKVVLDNGEIEVLATSLLDKQLYPQEDFKKLFWYRWGVETFYGTIKDRLALENFTGKTAESVKQDFYSTIFISNLETILTDDATSQLEEKSKNNKNSTKVNKSISFNAIKNNLICLLMTETDIDTLLLKMTKTFMSSPTSIRPGRKFKRETDKPRRALNHHKRTRKAVY